MKSKRFNKKLALKKITVADLNKKEMRVTQGGLDTVPPYCDTNYTNCIITVCNSRCPECGPPIVESVDIGCMTYENTCILYSCGCN